MGESAVCRVREGETGRGRGFSKEKEKKLLPRRGANEPEVVISEIEQVQSETLHSAVKKITRNVRSAIRKSAGKKGKN